MRRRPQRRTDVGRFRRLEAAPEFADRLRN
jgi:hypothetical protein